MHPVRLSGKSRPRHPTCDASSIMVKRFSRLRALIMVATNRAFGDECGASSAHAHMTDIRRMPKARFTSVHALRLAALICCAAMIATTADLSLAREAPQSRETTTVRETLGAGDSVRITVFQNPDLTTETRVSERGTIVFPLIGEVVVGGQTPIGAGARIAEQLKQGNFIRNPQVSVAVLQVRSRQVSVLGHVVRPGRYALDDTDPTLTDMLALAGGIDPSGADTVTVVGKRNGSEKKLEINIPEMMRKGDMSLNVEIENGDTIYVQ